MVPPLLVLSGLLPVLPLLPGQQIIMKQAAKPIMTILACAHYPKTLKFEIRIHIKPHRFSKSAAANINPSVVKALGKYLLKLIQKRFRSDFNIIMATYPQSKAST
jgi:hypothetical protein